MKDLFSKLQGYRLLVFFAFIFVNLTSNAKEFYVSPSGSDDAAGTIETPFASFEHARTKVREYKQINATEPITVFFRGGKYYLTEPVVFNSEDSGSEAAPITYKAYNNEVPEILGGERLAGLTWTKVDDHIYKTSVPAGLVFETLFINGEQKILARYPNYDANGGIFNGTASDCIGATKVRSWANPKDGYVHALHNNKWGGNHWRITGKKGSSELYLDGGFQNNRGGSMHSDFRYVENIYEELDDTNEWYLNRSTSELFYYPPVGLDLENAEVEVAALEQLLVLKGTEESPVQYISFEGLTLKRTIRTFMKTSDRLLRSDWCIYRGGVVHFEGTENCAITNCELSGLGGNAIFFNNYNKDGLVTGCHIYDVGASGVCFVGDVKTAWHENYDIGSAPDLAQLNFTKGPKTNNYPQNCKVDNNLIHNIGTVEKQPAGVQISLSAYITVSRNSIYEVPRAGINISEGKWSGHIIEYNDVFKTVLETHDHGAFNSWGRDRYYVKGNSNERVAAHGYDLVLLDILDSTIIRNNRFRCDHGWDIDLDDGSAYYSIYNNVCLSGGLKFRDGFLRTAKNNVLINNSFHPHVWFNNSGDVFKRNICIDAYAPIGMKSWGKEVDYNFFFTQTALENMQKNGTDEHSVFGDPLFVDPDNGDFTVADESPAFGLGYVNFPMDSFGVQKPDLKVIAETPEIPEINVTPTEILPGIKYMGGQIKNLETIEELSAVGLGELEGAWIIRSPYKWIFSVVKLEDNDVVLKLDDEIVTNINDFISKINGVKVYATMTVWRNQSKLIIDLPDFNDCTIPVELNSKDWTLISTDSEAAPDYLAKFAFDGNENTFWHTQFSGSEPPYPHEIAVDMATPHVLQSLEFLPRQGGYAHPRIFDFELYVSSSLEDWGEPVLKATLEDNGYLQSFKISEENDGQYFKFVGLSGNRDAAAIAEISFYGGCGVNASNISTETEILTFSLDKQASPAVINTTDHTIDIEVTNGTNLIWLRPTFTLSDGATSNPESGRYNDFRKQVEILVTAEDKRVTQVWKVNITVAEPNGVENVTDLNALFDVYPNPTDGLVNVVCNGILKGNLTYSIYTAEGRMLVSKTVSVQNKALTIDLSKYNKGVYLLQLTDGNEKSVRYKVVLK